MWRPNDWDKIKPITKVNIRYDDGFGDGVEAGADAMLKALKEGGAFIRGAEVASEPSVISINVPNVRGTVVFILDEEVK